MSNFEKLEIKCALVADHTSRALEKLGLAGDGDERCSIHFYDTRTLTLFDAGIILRSREAATEDVTMKIRGPHAQQSADDYATTQASESPPKVKFEEDVVVDGARAAAFSMTRVHSFDAIVAMRRGERTLESLFGAQEMSVYRALEKSVPMSTTVPFGPIAVQSWKLALAFEDKVTVELWSLGSVRLLELSCKSDGKVDEVARIANGFRELTKTWGVDRLGQSKTRFALTQLQATGVV